MKNNLIPQKYELCNRFSKKELAEICLGLSTAKDLHYIAFAKNNRILKKYCDRLLRRAEAYLQFVIAETQKRGNYDFLFANDIFMVFKKNRFIGLKIADENKPDKINPSEAEHTLNQEGS